MSRLELEMVENVDTSNSVLEKVELDKVTEAILNPNEVFIGSEFVTPIQDKGLCSASPMRVKPGRCEVGHKTRRVNDSLSGCRCMKYKLFVDSLSIKSLLIQANKVLSYVSLEDGLKYRVDELLLLIENLCPDKQILIFMAL